LALGVSYAAQASPLPFLKGPYLQSVTPTAVTVVWESETPLPGRVEVTQEGKSTIQVASLPQRLHEVRVEGLRPGQRYHYRVEAGAERQGGEFATAPAHPEPFSFVVYGDSRGNAHAHRAVVERVRREVPDFVLGTGDLVDTGENEKDWQLFFTVERDLLRETVYYPSVGNHDRQGRARTADNFRKYFALPADSPSPERYYAFSYSNTRVLVLDSNAYSFALTDQTAWLERELFEAVADPQRKHIFVVMHHPPYSCSAHGGQPELREMWTPLFEKYAVDAVFSGHDHVYERSENSGVHYFVTGGAGAPLYPRDPRPNKQDASALVYFERTFNYLRVQVVADFVEVTALRDDGTVIESLSWGRMPEPVASIARPMPVVQPALASVVPAPDKSYQVGGCRLVPGRPGLGPLTGLLVLVGALFCVKARRPVD
jgi:hypothetical protein